MGRKYRYPGSKPFEQAEKDLFFGREDDIERLTESIKVEQLLVLYGKSGLGKSSLLNAGVVPKLQATGEFDVCMVRLGSYQKDSEEQYTPPINRLLRAVRLNRRKESFLRKVHRDSHSLWQSYKGIQIAEESEKEFVLIIDQFEELFTYPDRDVRIFKEQLAEVLSGAVPQRFRNALKDKMDKSPEILSKDEMNLLYKKLHVHIVFAIRSDKLSLLNRLNNHIPTILQQVYELKPLTREQAEDAILNPADLPDDYSEFASPPFDYEDASLDKILNFLTRRNDKEIESFQLQILCQYVEENIVIANNDVSISADDLGNLEDIYLNYYDHQITKIEDERDREKARKLIEEGLIFDEEERRVSLYEGQILREYEISRDLLSELVDTHLLRSEPNPSGGFYYEISHDTLVAPILKSKEKRLEMRFDKERLERMKEKNKKDTRKLLIYIGLAALILGGLIGATSFYSVVQSRSDLKKANFELQKKTLELENLIEVNKKLADTNIGAITQQKDSLEQLYKKALDENERLSNEGFVIPVNLQGDSLMQEFIKVENELKATRARVGRLTNELNRLALKTNKERKAHYATVKQLNKELHDDIWKIVVRQKEFVKLRDGIVKKYKDYEKELDSNKNKQVKIVNGRVIEK